jgi:nicotinamidase-related amidase
MKTNRPVINPKATAVVTIDIQLDYFRGGKFPLWGAARALRRTRELLEWARQEGLPVIHVQHITLRPDARFLGAGTPGTALHPGLGLRPGEAVVTKHFPNSFRETDLEARLRARGAKTVVWAGMISWMCVDTTVRAAFDLGFSNILVKDATASGPLPRSVGRLPGIVPPWRAQSTFIAAIGLLHAKLVRARDLAGRQALSSRAGTPETVYDGLGDDHGRQIG